MSKQENKQVNNLQGNMTEKPKQKTRKRKPRTSNARPRDFKEFETLAKEILDGEGISYFEWLHKQHQEIILAFNLSNKKEIADLAREDD